MKTALTLPCIVGGLFLALAGCAERTVTVGCHVDLDCGRGDVCMAGVCLEAGSATAWQIEVIPPAEAPAARTEHPGFTFGTAATTLLSLGAKATVSGVVAPSDVIKTQPPTTTDTLHVQLSIPSRLSGMRDQWIEGKAAGGFDGSPATFTMSVPASALGTRVNARLVPPSPVDQQLPPWSGMVTVTESLALALPGLDQMFTIEGTLLDALQKPIAGFSARAGMGESIVSNKAVTGTDGAYKLLIVRPEAGLPLPTVDLSFVPVPAASGTPSAGPVPSLSVAAVKTDPAGTHMPSLSLPAYPPAEALRIQVVGTDSSATRAPVAGALLRFRASIPGASRGIATLVRETQTGADGMADVALIPGEAEAPRDYSVAVITPADSAFSSRCLPQYTVVAAGQAAGPRTGAPIELARRAALTGTITHAHGAPASQVAITAVRLPSSAPDACGDVAATLPATTLTGDTGAFALRLEPGRYRLEYRPPAGAPSPFHVEMVDVDGPATRNVSLPRGSVVDGRVEGPDAQPVGGCEIRVYAAAIEGPPQLAGQAVTGMDGRFRLVLPAP